jgi:hypothetical protein
MSADSDHDLFLSYYSSDRPAVMALKDLLEARGVKSFLDVTDLVPGLPWPAALEQALDRVRGVAVFIGQNGLGTWQASNAVLTDS